MMEITKMHERLRGNPLFSDPSSCLKPKSVCFDVSLLLDLHLKDHLGASVRCNHIELRY